MPTAIRGTHDQPYPTMTTDTARPLALRPREAARLLNISERKLWSLSQPRGVIPCKRDGGVVLYRPDDLDAWLRSDTPEAGEGSEQ